MTRHPRSMFGARVMALVIDFVILEIIHSLLFVLSALIIIKLMRFDPLSVFVFLGFCFLLFIVSFFFVHLAYFTLFHALLGQTVGKILMGIKVVVKDNGSISPARAFLRWCGYVLSFVPLGAGFLWAAVDRDQCAWHDSLAQTRVVPTEIT